MATYTSTIAFDVANLWPAAGGTNIQSVLLNTSNVYWIELTNGTFLRYNGFALSYTFLNGILVPSSGTYNSIEVTDAAGNVLATLADIFPEVQATDILNAPQSSVLAGIDTLHANGQVETLRGEGGDDQFHFEQGDFNVGDVINGGNQFDSLVLRGTDAGNANFAINGANISAIEALRFGNEGNSGATAFTMTLDWADVTGWANALHIVARNSTLASDSLQFVSNGATSLDLSSLTFESWNDNGLDEIRILGTEEADVIVGSSENDTFIDSFGADQYAGGGGDDTYLLSQGFPTASFDGGSGVADRIMLAGDGFYELYSMTIANVEQLHFGALGNGQASVSAGQISSFLGGGGFNVEGSGATAEIFSVLMSGPTNLNLATLQFDNWGIEDTFEILGSGGADIVVGSAENDHFTGYGGADQFNGGQGDDSFAVSSNAIAGTSFTGGAGSGDYVAAVISGAVDISALTLTEVEQLRYRAPSGTIQMSAGQLTGILGAGTFAVVGNQPASIETLSVNMAGAAALNLSALLFQNWGTNDIVTITGAAAAETITGTNVNDVIIGGGGTDSLSGGGGDDRLLLNGTGFGVVTVGAVLNGGGGADTLVATLNTGLNVLDLFGVTVSSIERLEFGGNAAAGVVTIRSSQLGTGFANDLQVAGRVGLNDQISFSAITPNATMDLRAITATNMDIFFLSDSLASNSATIWGTQYYDKIGMSGDGAADFLNGEGGADEFTAFVSSGASTFNGAIDGGTGTNSLWMYFQNATTANFNVTMSSVQNVSIDGAANATLNIAAANLKTGVNTVNALMDGNTFTTTINVAMDADTLLDLSALTLLSWNDTDKITINGDADAEEIAGTSRNDIIYGGGGGDYIDGGLGADQMHGGSGNDGFFVDNVADQIFTAAGQGIDAVVTSLSSYVLQDHLSSLHYASATGSFAGTGNALDNLIKGGTASDTLRGMAGSDYLAGYEGYDTYLLDADGVADYGIETNNGIPTGRLDLSLATSATTTVFGTVTVPSSSLLGVIGFAGYGSTTTGGGLGTDIFVGVTDILGSAFTDTMTGGSGNEFFNGGGGADNLTGGGGTNTLNGGDGDDNFYGGAGLDAMYGGNGTQDIVYYFNAGAGVTVNLYSNIANQGDAAFDTLFDIERIFGSNYQDSLTGDGADNTLYGHGGDDYLYGSDGNDVLIGGAGADRLYGHEGINTLFGGDDDDFFYGGSGLDTMHGEAGLNDYVDYQNSAGSVIVNLVTNVNIGGDAESDKLFGIERIAGSNNADLITGDNADNTIWGEGANDLMYGGGGNDLISAGVGEDYLFGDGGTNSLFGESGEDNFYGGSGNDFMYGGTGDLDIAYYYNSTVGVTVNLVTNTNFGGDAQGDKLFEIERVFGSNSADSITGNALGNSLYGYGGDDLITGGGGYDFLTGGLGADQFIYTNANYGVDIITDFVDGTDRLSFASSVADNISDFALYNNDSNSVVLGLNGTWIVVEGTSSITLTNDDFIFT